jgi:hypothetical protein
MYFTRFGYFVIFSILVVAVAAVILILSPIDFGGDDAGDGSGNGATSAPTATVTPAELPSLTWDQVISFARLGAVVDLEVTGGQIRVNMRPDFDVSGLNTTSHTFATSLPPGQNSVEAALRVSGIEPNTPAGIPVIRR